LIGRGRASELAGVAALARHARTAKKAEPPRMPFGFKVALDKQGWRH